MQRPKTVIIIAGPTAVGKTAVGIHIANHLRTEIISADSRQCYRELEIGVARPTTEELSQVKHHFIASHSIHEEINAADFERYALATANELFATHDEIVMVGGTGLYIKAFCEGLDEIPEIDPVIRNTVIYNYTNKGIHWLKEELKLKDPAFSETGEMHNPQRMMRALEVVESTGESILNFRKGIKAKRDFNIVKIGLQLPREEIIDRINKRIDQMMKDGLLEEVRQLLPFKNLNALQTVGYRELFDYFNGTTSLETAIEQIKINTRQYAKRQMTWFRKDSSFEWYSPKDQEIILLFIKNALGLR